MMTYTLYKMSPIENNEVKICGMWTKPTRRTFLTFVQSSYNWMMKIVYENKMKKSKEKEKN